MPNAVSEEGLKFEGAWLIKRFGKKAVVRHSGKTWVALKSTSVEPGTDETAWGPLTLDFETAEQDAAVNADVDPAGTDGPGGIANRTEIVDKLTAQSAAGGGIVRLPTGLNPFNYIHWDKSFNNVTLEGRPGTFCNGPENAAFLMWPNNGGQGTSNYYDYNPVGYIIGIDVASYTPGATGDTTITAIFVNGGDTQQLVSKDYCYIMPNSYVDDWWSVHGPRAPCAARRIATATPASGAPGANIALVLETALPTTGMNEAEITGTLTGGAWTGSTITYGGLYAEAVSTHIALFITGDGTGAAGYGVVGGGSAITSVVITSAGSGYTTLTIRAAVSANLVIKPVSSSLLVTAWNGGKTITVASPDATDQAKLAAIVPGQVVALTNGRIFFESSVYLYVVRSRDTTAHTITFATDVDAEIMSNEIDNSLSNGRVLLSTGQWCENAEWKNIQVVYGYNQIGGGYRCRIDGFTAVADGVGGPLHNSEVLLIVYQSQDIVIRNFRGKLDMSSCHHIAVYDSDIWDMRNHAGMADVLFSNSSMGYSQLISGARRIHFDHMTFKEYVLAGNCEDCTVTNSKIQNLTTNWALGGRRWTVDNLRYTGPVGAVGVSFNGIDNVINNITGCPVNLNPGSTGRYSNIENLVDASEGGWTHDASIAADGTLQDHNITVSGDLNVGGKTTVQRNVIVRGNLGIGPLIPDAKAHVQATSQATAALILEAKATAASPRSEYRLAKTTTANATPKTIYATPLDDLSVLHFHAELTGRDTLTGDSMSVKLDARAKREGGGAVVATAAVDQMSFYDSDDSLFTAAFDDDTNNVIVQVTGKAATDMEWYLHEHKVGGKHITLPTPNDLDTLPSAWWEDRLGTMWKDELNGEATLEDGDPVALLTPMSGANDANANDLGDLPIWSETKGLTFVGDNHFNLLGSVKFGLFDDWALYAAVHLADLISGGQLAGILSGGVLAFIAIDPNAAVTLVTDASEVSTVTYTGDLDTLVLVRLTHDATTHENKFTATGMDEASMTDTTQPVTFSRLGPPYLGVNTLGLKFVLLLPYKTTPDDATDLLVRAYAMRVFSCADLGV